MGLEKVHYKTLLAEKLKKRKKNMTLWMLTVNYQATDEDIVREVREELGLGQTEGEEEEEEEDLKAIATIPELQLALDTHQRGLLP